MIVVAAAACAPSALAGGKEGAPTSPKELFNSTRAHVIELKLSQEHWKLMSPGAGSRFLRDAQKARAKAPPSVSESQPDPAEEVALRHDPRGNAFAYVKCEINFDGQALRDVGIRYKGHFSFGASTSTPRRPFKIDFERFAEGQRFAGVSMVNLNNHAVDPSQARETLSYELFRKLAVPASRTGYALVYLTVTGVYEHEYLGLYTLIEEVDHKFLKKHFGHSNGLLVKPQGMRGLADVGDDWPAYASRYLPRGKVDEKLGGRLVELAKLVRRADDATFAKMVPSYLDVDELLRYVAVGGALADFDSFLSTGHNYYLYVNPADQRVSIIPWDLNMTFGGYSWVGTDAQIERLSVMKPYVDNNYLIERILAIPAYREAYRGHVRHLIDSAFSPETIKKHLASIAPVFEAADQAAKRAGKVGSATTRPATYPRLRQPDLMSYVEARAHSMRLQLDGKEPGYIPTFSDPEVVPQEWVKVAKPAYALLAALDADGNGRIDDKEFKSAVTAIFDAAHASAAGSIDLPTLSQSMKQLLTPNMRSVASAESWTKWLFKIVDADHDGKITPAELTTAYHRHLKGADMDFDSEMGGREMVEAMSGTGAP
jgi:spore coat protein CotH/Ca2+-binding EF-hand superfamily protein